MALSHADLSTLSRLLDQVMELAAPAVEPWLAALGPEHVHLVPYLREMLASRGSLGFLSSGPSLPPPDDSVASPADRVGPYRLIREIGKGGMGSVWLAEQVDGRLKRNVALKLPRLAWGAGLKERMKRERDIGALLEHPNIARLYDAGVDEKGRPYLALEYIDGVPLDQWRKAREPTIREQLQLFVQIAKAVAYAHGRLIVHRDLKPSNVLVTTDGQAHLLDFGIARLLDDTAPDGDLTQEQGRVLTPRYASPEQSRGETITVASDVYSLGVVLFEMLARQRPQGETPKASALAAEAGTRKMLRGELDSILAKALAARPAERYATAAAFADDVERHLAGERVVAQPDSFRYRVGKTLRRHRLQFVIAASFLGVVLTASWATLLQTRRALDAAQREQQVKVFVTDLFRTNARGEGASVRTKRKSADLLVENGGALIEARFPQQPELQAELYGLVRDVFHDMGAYPLAIDYGRKQLAAMARIGTGAQAQREAARKLGEALLKDGRLDEAEAAVTAALASADEPGKRRPLVVLLARIAFEQGRIAEVEKQVALARALRTDASIDDAWLEVLEGRILISRNEVEPAMQRFHAAVDTGVRVAGAGSRDVADLRLALGFWLTTNSHHAEAKQQIEAGLAILERASEASAVRAAADRAYYWSYMRLTDGVSFQEVAAAIGEARRFIEQTSVVVPDSVSARIDFEEGKLLLAAGDADHAERPLLAGIEAMRRGSRAPELLAQALSSEIVLLRLRGEHARARALMPETYRLRNAIGEGRTPWALFDFKRDAVNETMAGDYAAAARVIAGAPVFAANPVDPEGYAVADAVRWERVRLAVETGDAAEALQLSERLTLGPETPFYVELRVLRGEALCLQGRASEGLPLVLKAIALQSAVSAPMDPTMARYRAVAGNCALDLRDRARALAMARAAAAAFEQQPRVSPYFKRPLLRLARRLNLALGESAASSRP